ncbi:hypothetical protein OA101_00170 [Alphaproteobacteria bacterium]|nr:hypothetical protein [Alphaproteobacteria bacterium]
MEIWDHFDKNSVVEESTSTHFVNLPHFSCFRSISLIVLDDLHPQFGWFDLQFTVIDEKYHSHIKNYAEWLLKKLDIDHD